MRAGLKEGLIIGPQLLCVWPCQVVAQRHLSGTSLRRNKTEERKGGRRGEEWKKMQRSEMGGKKQKGGEEGQRRRGKEKKGRKGKRGEEGKKKGGRGNSERKLKGKGEGKIK